MKTTKEKVIGKGGGEGLVVAVKPEVAEVAVEDLSHEHEVRHHDAILRQGRQRPLWCKKFSQV